MVLDDNSIQQWSIDTDSALGSVLASSGLVLIVQKLNLLNFMFKKLWYSGWEDG